MSYTENEIIVSRNVEDEMKESYLRYSMSVIISRALPDVRDGLEAIAAPYPLRDAAAEPVARRQAP